MTWFGRRRDWAKAQRTIHNMGEQEASLVAQLREAERRNAELEIERDNWRAFAESNLEAVKRLEAQ